jgi:hypothetical protein
MYITAIFGSKYSLFVAIGFYAAGSLCFLAAQGFFLLSVGALLFGFYDQFISILLKMIMNDLFGAEFTHFLPICYAGFAFSSLIWPNVASVLTNPFNTPPNVPFTEDGQTVYYFDQDIVNNFQFFLKFQAAVHVVLLTSLTLFFENPRFQKSRVSAILDRISKGRIDHASVIIQHQKLKQDQRSRRLDRQTIEGVRNISFINSISKTYSMAKRHKLSTNSTDHVPFPTIPKNESMKDIHSIQASAKKRQGSQNEMESPLLEMLEIKKKPSDQTLPPNEHNPSDVSKRLEPTYDVDRPSPSTRLVKEKLTVEQKAKVVQEYKREEKRRTKSANELLWKANFVLIFLMCTIRSTTGRYYMSNFKIIGLYYFNDDTLINTIGSMVFGGYILMTFTFGYVFDTLGTRACHKITFLMYAIGNLVYALAPANLFLFVTFSFIHRVT